MKRHLTVTVAGYPAQEQKVAITDCACFTRLLHEEALASVLLRVVVVMVVVLGPLVVLGALVVLLALEDTAVLVVDEVLDLVVVRGSRLSSLGAAVTVTTTLPDWPLQ